MTHEEQSCMQEMVVAPCGAESGQCFEDRSTDILMLGGDVCDKTGKNGLIGAGIAPQRVLSGCL